MLNALFGQRDSPNTRTGTTSPIFIPRGPDPQPVKPGEYFAVKIHSAQAVFRGPLFEHAEQLVVTSRVNLHHLALGNEEVFALQRSRAVHRDQAVQLGLSQNLISLVPATMTHVTVSIEFLLDVQNRLAALGALINDNSFLAAISLAPGAAAAAKTIGALAQKVFQTFIPAEERRPILQFAGDFNLGIGGNDLIDGYYAILGTRSEHDPIPEPLPVLGIRDSGLLADGREVTQLSYVVLEVARVPVRTRDLNGGAAWDQKLREAQALAQEVADAPYPPDDNGKQEVWKKCAALLQEGRALLLADPNYAEAEASSIYKVAFKQCADLVAGKVAQDVSKGLSFSPLFAADSPGNRELLGIGAGEDLDRIISEYTRQTEDARRLLQASGDL
jgi:hypothetical protein